MVTTTNSVNKIKKMQFIPRFNKHLRNISARQLLQGRDLRTVRAEYQPDIQQRTLRAPTRTVAQRDQFRRPQRGAVDEAGPAVVAPVAPVPAPVEPMDVEAVEEPDQLVSLRAESRIEKWAVRKYIRV